MSYRLVTNCRACGYGPPPSPGGIKSAPSDEKLIRVLDLGVQPLANAFRRDMEPRPGHYPLAVDFCPQCSLAQLSVVVDPTILYSDYAYRTSPSHTMREHFEALVGDILTEITPGSVVEIGSNDGLFLAFLTDHGFGNVVGIDPAKNLAARAREVGIITGNDFFRVESAHAARTAAGEVNLIVARHVFCHIADWHAFIGALDVLASKETLIVIEVPYVSEQLTAGSFDQVYHEHLSYLSVKAMKALLNESHFHMHRICHYPVHGGAIGIMIRRNDSSVPPHPTVAGHLQNDEVTLERWKEFGQNSDHQISELALKVSTLVRAGNRVVGYGASAKSTVWINACGLRKRHLEAVYDGTEEKQYCCIPGTDIPVKHEGAFYADAADYAIIFAWNFADEIIRNNRKWMEGGGKFIVPVPKLRVISLDAETVQA